MTTAASRIQVLWSYTFEHISRRCIINSKYSNKYHRQYHSLTPDAHAPIIRTNAYAMTVDYSFLLHRQSYNTAIESFLSSTEISGILKISCGYRHHKTLSIDTQRSLTQYYIIRHLDGILA